MRRVYPAPKPQVLDLLRGVGAARTRIRRRVQVNIATKEKSSDIINNVFEELARAA